MECKKITINVPLEYIKFIDEYIKDSVTSISRNKFIVEAIAHAVKMAKNDDFSIEHGAVRVFKLD